VTDLLRRLEDELPLAAFVLLSLNSLHLGIWPLKKDSRLDMLEQTAGSLRLPESRHLKLILLLVTWSFWQMEQIHKNRFVSIKILDLKLIILLIILANG